MPSPSKKIGKYVVCDLLGRGSMGMVFLARDPTLEREVAVKVMVGASVYDEKMRARFEREAKAVARLHHPNIVTIHDLGYDADGSPFIAMELLDGKDLEELVEKELLSLRQKLEIITQVCRGLEHAHRNGIVHRDVKPDNIFVAEDLSAKIMDFGVARCTQSTQTQAGIVVGTAGYMSPEQLRGKPVDGRSDVFSLGIVLFEILTNQVLFSGDSIEATFFQTLSKETPPLVMPDGTKLPELQDIVNRALAKDASDRYSSAEEMAEAIQAFLRTHGEVAREKAFFLAPEQEPDSTEIPLRIGLLRENEIRGIVEDRAPRGRTPSKPPEIPSLVGEGIPARVPAPAIRRRSTGGVGQSSHPSPSRFPWVAALVVLLVAAVGAYLFMLRHSESLVDPENPIVLAEEAPENKHEASPGVEERAEPTPRERAAIFAADAALALGSGELKNAEVLIGRGEQLDPRNPRWAALRDQLRAKQVEAERKSRAADYVGKGGRLVDAGDYQKAIDAYEKALEYDSENPAVRSGLERAVGLKQQEESVLRSAAALARRFVESETQFTPGASESKELMGFEMEEGLEVKETADPFFPAQIVIEFNPADAMPGEPYLLQVRIFNEGYRAIEFIGLELVSRFGGKTTGKGQPIPLRVREVAPQATAILHEVAGTWNELQNHGEIEATLTLLDGGKLSKSVRW